MEFNIKQSKGHPHSWWNHWFGSIAKPAVNASGHTWDRVTAGDWKYFLKGSTRRSINQLNTPLEMFTIGQHTQLDQRISLREGVIKFRLLHRGLSETMHTVEETAIINPQNMECCCCTTQLTAEQSTMNATLKIYIVPAWIWFELPGEQDLLNRLLRHFAWAPLPTPTQDLGVVCGFWFSTSLQAFQWPPPSDSKALWSFGHTSSCEFALVMFEQWEVGHPWRGPTFGGLAMTVMNHDELWPCLVCFQVAIFVHLEWNVLRTRPSKNFLDPWFGVQTAVSRVPLSYSCGVAKTEEASKEHEHETASWILHTLWSKGENGILFGVMK